VEAVKQNSYKTSGNKRMIGIPLPSNRQARIDVNSIHRHNKYDQTMIKERSSCMSKLRPFSIYISLVVTYWVLNGD